MAKYINAAEAAEKVAEATGIRIADLVDVFAEISAADVVPVVHGRWILEREPNGKPYCFHCSVCDSDYHCIGIVVASDYCPNCGARMDGGAENG